MAESHARARLSERAGRPQRSRALTKAALLTGAIVTVLLSGLFIARPAAAAPARPAASLAHPTAPSGHLSHPTAPSGHLAHPTAAAHTGTDTLAAPVTQAKLDALVMPDGGICDIPGAGDLLNLAGLCNNGGITGDLNNICTPSTPQPEQATAGVDSLIAIPGGQTGGKTLYDNYGLAGQYWAAYGLHCSDITSLIGNNVAGMVFDMAKSLDRVTITIYQSAAGNGILAWLQNAVNQLITALGKAIYFPFLAPVVIIGAIWLAWQGLIRKRATRTIEGTLWMVLACAAAIWLIGRPADFTGVGTSVSNGVTQVLNVAFAKLPGNTGGNCLPIQPGDPQSVPSNYVFSSSNGLVDENANELWSVLVCKPWLDGEFGTTLYSTSKTQAPTVVNQYGRDLLWAQAIAANEQPTTALIAEKQDVYGGIAKALQANYPAVYPLFQGDEWTSRLEIGFEALFAAVAAGLLVLLVALTLIVLKLGFLLLLVAGPFFLLFGTHPGFGRVIAIRWFEMLVGVLMKQIAIALVLSVLLYCYSLIMSTTDTALPWALKIMMIALVTAAVFIYRRPFQHLFSAVGYGVIGSEERAEYTWREATYGFRRASATAAGVAIPGVAAYRAARWARRNPSAAAAAGAAGPPGAAAMAGPAGEDAAAGGTAGGTAPALPGASLDGHTTGRLRPEGPPSGGADGSGGSPSGGGSGGSGGAAGGAAGGGRGRNWPEAGSGTGRQAPPLPLPPTGGGPAPEGASAGWARGSARRATSTGRAAGSAPVPGPPGNGGSGNGGSGSAGSSRVGTRPRPSAQSAPRSVPRTQAPRSAPSRTGNGSAGNGSTSTAGGGSGAASGRPAGGRGWFGGTTVRSDLSTGAGAAGKRSPMPFWLRPIRRDK
jgi:TrbL/VirB6 plasmid conjugal transfer protein